MGRIHNINKNISKMNGFQILLLASGVDSILRKRYNTKCRYGKYFLCARKGYKNDLPRSLRSTPFRSPDRAILVCGVYRLFDNKRYKSKLNIK